MNTYPSLSEMKQIAQQTGCRRIPLCTELYADRFTPVEVMRTLRAASKHCFLLESAERDQTWGRYSFLGYDPSLCITRTNGNLVISRGEGEDYELVSREQVEHPNAAIRSILAAHASPTLPGLPTFTGGAGGIFLV